MGGKWGTVALGLAGWYAFLLVLFIASKRPLRRASKGAPRAEAPSPPQPAATLAPPKPPQPRREYRPPPRAAESKPAPEVIGCITHAPEGRPTEAPEPASGTARAKNPWSNGIDCRTVRLPPRTARASDTLRVLLGNEVVWEPGMPPEERQERVAAALRRLARAEAKEQEKPENGPGVPKSL